MAQPNDSSDTKPLPEATSRFIGETLNCRGQTADGLRRIPRRSARNAEQPGAKRHCPEGAGDDGGQQTLGASTPTSSNMSYTIDVYNVPVHYTPGDMEELLEASGIEAPWFESAQFLKPLADDPEFCAVLLRYSDEQSAQVTTRHLDGQDVASESGKARRLGVKFNRVQVSSSIPEDQLQDNAGSHMTDIPSDNDDALHEEPTKVESVSPEELEEFCERWGFKHLTNLWIASLPVGVQSGIVNKYNPNDECSEEDNEDPSSFLLTGLPADADENIVKALLFVYGVVKSCRMQPPGASCASATVLMESMEDARAAAEGLNGMTLDGCETPLTASLQDADALQTKRMEKDSRRLAALESLAGSLQAAERHSAFGFLDRLARQQASKAGEASSASGNKKFTLERRRRQAEAAATAEAPRITVPPGKQKIIVPPLRRPRIIEPPCKSDPNGQHSTNLRASADGRALPLPPPPHNPSGYHEAQPLPHAPPPLPVWQPLLPHPLPPPPGRGAPPAGWGAPPPGWGAPPPGWGAPPPGCFSPLPGSVGYNPYAPPPVGRLPGPPAPGPPAPGPPAPGPPAYPKLAYGSIERSNVQVGKAKPPAHPPPAHLRR